MLFDIEIPRVIDRHMGAYDTTRIKETYDIMDVKCKKEYICKNHTENRIVRIDGYYQMLGIIRNDYQFKQGLNCYGNRKNK